MTFVNPLVLWALSLTAIPIIIHLFNFRRYKTVYFTNVKFLKEVTEETAVRSKVKHWLVLVSRILGIAFLVFAFAQPVIPLEKDTAVAAGRRGISVYVDNSFSMSAETEDEQLLNRAVRRAREIANAYGDDDRFQLLTNEF
ncbi:MAG TPA: BatA domain-containing protein, partial [Chitinophagales bacterium]|nr:BatA domain-containing protein [Chitinophagales bacterium]